eukprot:UN03060
MGLVNLVVTCAMTIPLVLGTPLSFRKRSDCNEPSKVGSRRQAWRSLESEKHQNKEELNAFKAMVERELNDYCGEILSILKDCLIDETAKKYWSDLFKDAEAKDKAKELSFSNPEKAKRKEVHS